jgi:hypothetical protein
VVEFRSQLFCIWRFWYLLKIKRGNDMEELINEIVKAMKKRMENGTLGEMKIFSEILKNIVIAKKLK